MNKHNILSKNEMKNVFGGGCPAWYQSQCLQQAASEPSSGDPIEDDIIFNLILETCLREWDSNPDNNPS
ncbi:hypothetical protein FA048_05775 [Pedobacter polaris]|uniref:Bacteriocin n=1 Tax=Pedobacter polaris TaxID=2571273 RepID=A0A4U1CXK0_9SPHI|nr:hypothetical protein [Pedobacter polaris]TKC13120.1 hypothetical protein FA048_05775 [Pedobacter polaris]